MSKTGTSIWTIVVLMGLAAMFDATAHGADRRVDFGRHWVRSHPYTLMGLCAITDLDVERYRQAGLNTGLAWTVDEGGKGLRDAMHAGNLPWLGHLRAPTSAACRHMGSNQQFRDEFNSFMKLYDSTCLGWILNDESSLNYMPSTNELIVWTRQNYPDLLAISNALCLGTHK